MAAKFCRAHALVIVAIIIKTLEGGTFFEDSFTVVSNSTVLKRWEGLSPTSCLLRCRRNKACKMAGMIDSDCLLLKTATASDDGGNGNGNLRVKLLKEMDTKKKPSKKGKKQLNYRLTKDISSDHISTISISLPKNSFVIECHIIKMLYCVRDFKQILALTFIVANQWIMDKG